MNVELASEYRYRSPVSKPGHARDRHVPVGRDGGHARGDPQVNRAGETIGITNVRGSTLSREADAHSLHRSGPGNRRGRDEDFHRSDADVVSDRGISGPEAPDSDVQAILPKTFRRSDSSFAFADQALDSQRSHFERASAIRRKRSAGERVFLHRARIFLPDRA